MQVPQPLVDTIARRRSFAIVGAGFSKNAVLPPTKTMPDWDEMTRLLNRGLLKPFRLPDDLTPTKKASLYKQVASRFETEHSRPGLLTKLKQILHFGRAQPGKAHIALARLPFEFVYTTNFDNLLEKSYERVDKRYRVVSMEETLALLGDPEETTIVKMHGDLASGNVVITERDYKSYKAHHDAILTHLTSLMITHTPLIVGYSLRDPHLTNVRRYVKRRLKRYQRMSYYTKLDCTSHEFEKALKKHLQKDLG